MDRLASRRQLRARVPLLLCLTTLSRLRLSLGTASKQRKVFAPLDLHTSGTNESALLDFFTYNPVDHSYPRLGIVNLNTKNEPVLAAILQMTLKEDFDVFPGPSPSPTPAITHAEAMAAAHAIVNVTTAAGGAAVYRSDISRLTEEAVATARSAYAHRRNMINVKKRSRALCLRLGRRGLGIYLSI